MKNNRRDFIKKSACVASVITASGLTAYPKAVARLHDKQVKWPVTEGPDTPKLCAGVGRDPQMLRMMKQIGVNYGLGGGGRIPWTVANLRERMAESQKQGIATINLMIGGFPNAIYGREGRDEEIENVKESVVAAGIAGIPIVEYNWYAHRLMEGYYRTYGRGGSGRGAFDYGPVKNLPPLPEVGAYSAEQLWENLTYFLKAVIPVAEKAGVRLALHPNDPPAAISRGSEQIMASLSGWKRLIEIVDSPSNGITFDPGVTTEIGEDPVEVLRYFGTRDRINHMHYRNVIVHEPSVKYEEVFMDVGQANMFAVMREAFRVGYKYYIYPEHPMTLDYDEEHPQGTSSYILSGGYTGVAWNVAYCRAMMQAVMSLEIDSTA